MKCGRCQVFDVKTGSQCGKEYRDKLQTLFSWKIRRYSVRHDAHIYVHFHCIRVQDSNDWYGPWKIRIAIAKKAQDQDALMLSFITELRLPVAPTNALRAGTRTKAF